jgi:hypothetical protein
MRITSVAPFSSPRLIRFMRVLLPKTLISVVPIHTYIRVFDRMHGYVAMTSRPVRPLFYSITKVSWGEAVEMLRTSSMG